MRVLPFLLFSGIYFQHCTEAFLGLPTSVQFGADIQKLLQTISQSTNTVILAIYGLEATRNQLSIPEVEPAKEYFNSFREHAQVYKQFTDKLSFQVVDTLSMPENISDSITSGFSKIEDNSIQLLDSASKIDGLFHSDFVGIIQPTSGPSLVFAESFKNILNGVRSLGTRKQIAAVDVNGILRFTDVHAIATYLFSFNTTLNQILSEIGSVMTQMRSILNYKLVSTVHENSAIFNAAQYRNSMTINFNRYQFGYFTLISNENRAQRLQVDTLKFQMLSYTSEPISLVSPDMSRSLEDFSLSYDESLQALNTSIYILTNEYNENVVKSLSTSLTTFASLLKTGLTTTVAQRVLSGFRSVAVSCATSLQNDASDLMKLTIASFFECSNVELTSPAQFYDIFSLYFNHMKSEANMDVLLVGVCLKYVTPLSSEAARYAAAKCLNANAGLMKEKLIGVLKLMDAAIINTRHDIIAKQENLLECFNGSLVDFQMRIDLFMNSLKACAEFEPVTEAPTTVASVNNITVSEFGSTTSSEESTELITTEYFEGITELFTEDSTEQSSDPFTQEVTEQNTEPPTTNKISAEEFLEKFRSVLVQ